MKAENIFTNLVRIQKNWIFQDSIDDIDQKNHAQTQQIFSEKWSQFEQGETKKRKYTVLRTPHGYISKMVLILRQI